VAGFKPVAVPKQKILLTCEMPESGMSLLRARSDVEVSVLPAPTEAHLRARIVEADRRMPS
jgi:hypothetical protein